MAAWPAPRQPINLYEATCFAGTEPWVTEEIRSVKRLRVEKQHHGVVIFSFRGEGVPWSRILPLTLPTSVYKISHFDIPRPKALLGDQHFRRLTDEIQLLLRESGRKNYRTMTLEAAGRESAIMQRLADELALSLRLKLAEKEGDLQLRVRPAKVAPAGWEMLTRLGHRPLSTRPWRVADLPGALNGPVAALMNQLADIGPTDRTLNVACGSGTLLIEHHELPGMQVGGDLSVAPLALARKNLRAAGVQSVLIRFDGGALPFRDRSFDVLTADLPWGQLVGSQRENEKFYPAFIAEGERILTPGGRLVVLTHNVRRFRQALEPSSGRWQALHDLSIKMGRAQPRLIALLKTER